MIVQIRLGCVEAVRLSYLIMCAKDHAVASRPRTSNEVTLGRGILLIVGEESGVRA